MSPVYNYQARTKEGETQSGRVDAADKRRASEILQRNGLIVISIEEAREIPLYARRLRFLERIGGRDLVVFTRQLTTLFEAEVPLIATLQTVASQTEKLIFREKIFEISADVEGDLRFQTLWRVIAMYFPNSIRIW